MGGRVTVAVSLKMYFGHAEARAWFRAVATIAGEHPAVAAGAVDLFVIPSYLAIIPALRTFDGTRVQVGAQDVAAAEPGPHTGEVSAAELAEIGVRFAEVGHAERRRGHGETDDVVAAKATAALRHGIVPVVCVGEETPGDPTAAARESIRQLRRALAGAPGGRVVVGYEPIWAIGAAEPAKPGHIQVVCTALSDELAGSPERAGSTVIYGGSAGPGLLAKLGGTVDGLFLGRRAHHPADLRAVLDEAAARA